MDQALHISTCQKLLTQGDLIVLRDIHTLMASDYFDADWYLENNPSVAKSGLDPYYHYVVYGWREHLEVSSRFSCAKYLAANPDLNGDLMSPLLHYLRYGMSEGRPLMPPGVCDNIAREIARLQKDRKERERPSRPMEVTKLPAELTETVFPADIGSLALKVLIVAELSIPQCKYYRVDQKVAMLKTAKIPVEVANWTDQLDCFRKMQTATVVIFYRVPYFEVVQRELAEARRLGLRVGFDVDDIVFDEVELAKNRSLDALSVEDREGVFRGAALYRGLLEKCDFTIASTQTLSTFMQRYCKGPAYVVPNAICKDLLPAQFKFPLGLSGKIVIGYGSGTNTHDADFEQCAGAVVRIMGKYPQVELALHGQLAIPDSLKPFSSRIRRVPFVPFSEYSNALSRFDINLIPLQKSVFNDCKSNIKYLEASRCGLPSVASPRAEFSSVINSGVNGYLAKDEEEWFNALESLVKDADLRKKMGATAHETVMRQFDGDVIGEKCLIPAIREQTAMPQGKRQRKILFVNILYSPTSFGGATILLENIVEEMAKKAQVAVFSICWDGKDPQGTLIRYHSKSAMCFRVESEPYGSGERDYQSAVVSKAFKEVLSAYRPDIVHFHSIQQMGVSMLQACNDAGCPYMVTAHDAWWICPRQFMLDDTGTFCHQDENGVDLYRCAQCCGTRDLFSRQHLLSDMLRQAKAVLTPSDYQTSLYIKSGFPSELVRTNRNGIAVPGVLSPHKLVGKKISFAYLGGKCDHKGYYFLKEIVKRLTGDYSLKLVDIDLKFGRRAIFATDWPEPDRVVCCEPFDAAEIDRFYAGVDVLVFPSCWKESFGLTIREALARNVWVIATESGGDISRDLKDGKNGDLIAFGDEVGFARAMQRLIDNPRRLDGYVNAYRRSITTVAQQVDELFKDMDRCLKD